MKMVRSMIANFPLHDIVYLSFGSFLANAMSSKFTKTVEDQFGFATDQVLAKSWFPQKDFTFARKILLSPESYFIYSGD